MKIPCPVCNREVDPDQTDDCAQCGAVIAPLRQIMLSAADSVRLALESLREGRDREALDYAYEAWGLMHTSETAAIGLLAAVKVDEGTEVTRWLRRRRFMSEETEGEEES
jgi:hypothetical protein